MVKREAGNDDRLKEPCSRKTRKRVRKLRDMTDDRSCRGAVEGSVLPPVATACLV